MPRIYTVSHKFTTISAAQDLISLKGSAGKVCRLRKLSFLMNDTSLQTAQGLRLNLKFSTATITLGSGGTVPTPRKYDQGDSAASFTCHVNDTTPATTSGAFTDLLPVGGHNYGGFFHNWGDKGPIFSENQGLVFELLSTVTGTCNYSGYAEVEEIG